MNAKTSLAMVLLAAAGTAVSIPSAALGAAKVINISGATLLENLVKAPGTTNDFIDVDGDGIAGSLGSFIPDQLAPFDATLDYNGADEIWVVQYSVVGSVQGVQELIDFGRPQFDTSDATDTIATLELKTGLRALAYHNRVLYINGGASANAIFNAANPAGHPVRSDSTFTFTNSTSAPNGIQIDIAPTDVPTTYAVTKPGGAPGPELDPFDLGYGLNPTLSNNKNSGAPDGATQLLAELTGTRNINEPDNISFVPNSDTIYDTAISYAPIAVMTSLGVGKSQITTTELRHLSVTGRLPSGQNLVMITRDAGSGTRNGFQNSIGIDPSWGAGDNVGPTNTGGTSGSSPNLAGPNYIPTNKAGSSDVERTLRNTRLGICYSGAERAVTSSTVTTGQMEILAVKNDHKAGNIGTAFARPSFLNVANNSVDGYRIGGFAVLASLGDPKAEPISAGGLNNGEVPMSNPAAAAYLNNIRASIENFVSVPASPDNELMPAEAIVQLLLLPDVLNNVAVLADPDAWVPSTRNVPLFNASQAISTLTNAVYNSFGTVTLNGQSPSRTAGVNYTDNNGIAGSFFVLQDGTTLNYNVLLTGLNQRNRIAGDANGDGLRDIADIPQLVAAFQSTAPSPGIPGSWAAPNGIFGAGAGAKASREILFDFNCDGNFNLLDVRYFLDGLATEVTGSNNFEGALNRAQAFIDADNAAGTNLFGTTLANGTYDAGDSRADIAGPALGNGTAPGWAPIGADGIVDDHDIDYIYANFGTWADINDAAFMDLTADITGDLIVDQNDICAILEILETTIGDVNLDGIADGTDLAIATGNLGNAGVGFAGGDVDGDGTVTQADLDLISGASADPCNPAPACSGDVNGDGGTNALDFNILAGNFGAGPGATRAQGDLNGDGFVNALDFNLLAGDFGCSN